jgi:Icc-related predicted phosphoesterase
MAPVTLTLPGGLRAQIVSDVHIPQWVMRGSLPPFVADPTADLLILAGDVCNGLPNAPSLSWLRSLSDSGDWPQGILMVLGNHDYYGLDLVRAADLWRDTLASTRIQLLARERVKVGAVRIAGGTLWTDYDRANPFAMMLARQSLSDHFCIENGSSKALPDAMLAAHYADLQFIMDQAPGSESDPLVVVTHHAPSLRSVSPDFEGDAINPAFVSDLEYVMRDLRPNVWVHGHVHSRHDYSVDATRVVCNPMGYPGEIHSAGMNAVMPKRSVDHFGM